MKSTTMLLMLCLLAATLACNLQINVSNEEQPHPTIASRSPTAVLGSSTKAATTTATATRTLRPTNTATATLAHLTDLPNVLTFGGGATSTVAPPVPGFPDVLTFGGAGGGGDCGDPDVPRGPYGVSLLYAEPGTAARFCTTIWRPLQGIIQLELFPPSGSVVSTRSGDITYNPSAKAVEWAGYSAFASPAQQTSDGTLFAQLTVWWPVFWPAGEWRVRVYGGQSAADLSFRVGQEKSRTLITALNAQAGIELMPAVEPPLVHPLWLNADGAVHVVGINYPPATPVYVLLYRIGSDDYHASLVQKLAVTSDSNGEIRTVLPGPFEIGPKYVLIGVTDPHSLDASEMAGCSGQPCEMFRVVACCKG